MRLVACAKLHSVDGCYHEMGLRAVDVNQSCQLPMREIILNSLIAGLVNEGRIQNGSWVDAGTDDGKWPLYYACILRRRAALWGARPGSVYTFDARWRHIAAVSRKVIRHENMQPIHGMLGAAGRGVPDHPRHQDREPNTTIFAVDALYSSLWSGQRFVFGHFDVEGWELEVLHGGHKTIMRDRPVLVIEVHVHADPLFTGAVCHCATVPRCCAASHEACRGVVSC